MGRWIIISGYEIYVVDGKVNHVVKTDINGIRVTAYIYRKAGDVWQKEDQATPAAVRAGLKRGTIRIT